MKAKPSLKEKKSLQIQEEKSSPPKRSDVDSKDRAENDGDHSDKNTVERVFSSCQSPRLELSGTVSFEPHNQLWEGCYYYLQLIDGDIETERDCPWAKLCQLEKQWSWGSHPGLSNP